MNIFDKKMLPLFQNKTEINLKSKNLKSKNKPLYLFHLNACFLNKNVDDL